MSGNSITLAGVLYDVHPLPFKQLRVLTPLFSQIGRSLGRGELTDEVLDTMGRIVTASMRKTPEEFGEIAMGMDELAEAFQKVAEVTGLAPKTGKPREDLSGEVMAGRGTGTTSTPTSLPAPVGPGSTSTTT
ncbi:MAG TPA: hypothetical protein VLC92_01160 [Rhodocyclaceae bacterium]|nr:hypothetical protein [Rhodocyclaceae bacterium]